MHLLYRMQMLVGWLRPQAPEIQSKALWLCSLPIGQPSFGICRNMKKAPGLEVDCVVNPFRRRGFVIVLWVRLSGVHGFLAGYPAAEYRSYT